MAVLDIRWSRHDNFQLLYNLQFGAERTSPSFWEERQISTYHKLAPKSFFSQLQRIRALCWAGPFGYWKPLDGIKSCHSYLTSQTEAPQWASQFVIYGFSSNSRVGVDSSTGVRFLWQTLKSSHSKSWPKTGGNMFGLDKAGWQTVLGRYSWYDIRKDDIRRSYVTENIQGSISALRSKRVLPSIHHLPIPIYKRKPLISKLFLVLMTCNINLLTDSNSMWIL